MKKYLAFLKKDFLVESSYKMAFLLDIFGVLTSLLTYFFIDKLFGRQMAPQLQEFKVNYFSYVLLGSAFFSYVGTGLNSFSGQIRSEQTQGTLEAILLTPTRPSAILISMGLWNIIFATVNLLLYILMGIFVFNVDFSRINILSASILLLLTITSFSSLGILSACFIMVFKRGNPLSWLVSNIEGLLGGVYFPIAILPGWLQFISHFLPITYAIRGIQLAVFRGYSLSELYAELLPLLAFTALLLPLSLRAFELALKKARKDGSLTHF